MELIVEPRGMKPRLVMPVVSIAICILFSCTAAVALNSAAAPSFVRDPVDRHVYPAISVAVGNPSAGLIAAFAHGKADIGRGAPLTTDTPMRMASVSKSITAAAVLMLDQAGKLSIDKPVATYVPLYTSSGATITVRQLLAMSSGIPGRAHGDPILHGDGAFTQAEFFRQLNATPLYATPGTAFDYSNAGYYLLANVVQNVGGESFARWLHEHIFKPAGMTHTYSDEGQANDSLAAGYVHRTAQDPFIQCPAPDWSGELGAGGIISTPSDIVRFDIALLNGTLIDARHRQEMLAPATPIANGVSYALGWFALPDGTVQHDGDFSVVASTNVIFPDGTAVAQAANAANLAPDFDRAYFAKQMHNAYAGKAPIALGSPNPPSLLGMIGPFSTCKELDEQLFGK